MGNLLPVFDPDFATPAQWAAMYRAVGLQIIPGWLPGEGTGSWKRPYLSQWQPLQEALVPAAQFERWYGPNGEHQDRGNLGVITGRCSGNAFVIDLDIHKHPEAAAWWNAVLEVENNGLDLETVEQRTGGGGIQKLFLAPEGFVVPTAKTSIGVDIRGQGGFAVLPPSLHESGQHYDWLPGRAPWEIAIEVAPAWLLEAIADLAEAHGSVLMSTMSERPIPTSTGGISGEQVRNEFGTVIDGREHLMRDIVWHAVLELYRIAPMKPQGAELEAAMEAAWASYEMKVATRVAGADKVSGLAQEDRGRKEFGRKWKRVLRLWDSPKMKAEAAKPPPVKPNDFGLEAPQNDFGDDFPNAEPKVDPVTGMALPLLLTAQQFVDGFTPPAYTIDGIVQRGYLYALTARTGHGKTAVAMYIAQCVARGVDMHNRRVKQGTVLFLAGENPDDIRARFLVLAHAYDFDVSAIKVRFIAGVVSIVARFNEIRAEAAGIDDLMLVIVDTAAAYFPGDETNSNSQQGAYARLLRQLTFLPGKPTVIVNCHPIKNAAHDNLLPMGGSAFVNEVDGNLTLWANGERQTALHWQGKFRGPEFEPLSFELRMTTAPTVADAEGRLMPSVVAVSISEMTLEQGSQTQEADEDRLMKMIDRYPKGSFSYLAECCGFVTDGRPSKAKVQRLLTRLAEDGMVRKHRGGKYRLTIKARKDLGLDAENDD